MTDTPPPLRRPALIELDDTAQPDPAAAPPILDAPDAARAQAAARIMVARPSGLGRLALWAFGALFSFVLAVTAWDFVAGLMARSPVLGALALGLTALAVVAAVALGAREWAAYLRLARLDRLRHDAALARAGADLPAARAAVAAVAALYRHRPELAEHLARLDRQQAETYDPDALIDMAERALIAPLDAQARVEIEASVRQVAMVTALVPLALADVATAAFANLRMIRRIAEIYGGRSGGFASWGLLRRVFAALVATGAVALTDDLIGTVAGGGVLSKLSRRFGEGVVNGALTARIGLAAMELCRPLPFAAEPRPGVSALVGGALGGLFDRGG